MKKHIIAITIYRFLKSCSQEFTNSGYVNDEETSGAQSWSEYKCLISLAISFFQVIMMECSSVFSLWSTIFGMNSRSVCIELKNGKPPGFYMREAGMTEIGSGSFLVPHSRVEEVYITRIITL